MNTRFMQEIIRELKTELFHVEKKVLDLKTTDEAQLYYNGVIVGLKLSICKYEQWLYDVKPIKKEREALNHDEKKNVCNNQRHSKAQ